MNSHLISKIERKDSLKENSQWWMELSIVVNHEVEYDVTEILESYGSNGVVIEDSNILEEQPIDKFGEIYDLNPEDYPEKGVRLKAYFNEFTYNENLKSNINYEILSLQQIDKTIYDYQEKLIAEVDGKMNGRIIFIHLELQNNLR